MMTAVTPDDIHWRGAGPLRVGRCPVCGCDGEHAAMLDVPALSPPHQLLTLIRCSHCESAFYDPPDVRDFSDLGGNEADFWRFYIEVGCGVWETVWPLLAERATGSRSLLDVGCGFGFTLDFWRRRGLGDVCGVELASYGRDGAAQLDVPIHSELLERCAALRDRRFDVVYASEVIEHVPDPRTFVQLLARWVDADGVLVLTTPNAGYIVPEQRSLTQAAALAPGFHGFLLSSTAFEDVARSAGFDHVDVRVFGERQVLWASRRPINVDPLAADARNAYLDYLGERFALPDDETPLWQALAYRRVRDLLNAGRLAESAHAARRLDDAMARRFGPDVLDPTAVVARLREAKDLSDLGRVAPHFIACLYFFQGALAEHHQRDFAKAGTYYGAACAAIEANARFGAILALEALSLLWPARAAHAMLQIETSAAATGVAMLARLAENGTECRAQDLFATAPPALVESTLSRAIDRLVDRGLQTEASTLLAAYRAYAERRYGDRWSTAPGIEHAMTRIAQPKGVVFEMSFSITPKR